jgi:hypothetical protein
VRVKRTGEAHTSNRMAEASLRAAAGAAVVQGKDREGHDCDMQLLYIMFHHCRVPDNTGLDRSV